MQSTERWLPVVGYEGIYEVSDSGRVRSLDRVSERGHNIRGRMLKLVSRATDGPEARQTVSLHRDRSQRTRLVHHLVLEAFVGPRPDDMEACHWDGNAANNVLSNLRWDTHGGNVRDQVRHGTHSKVARTHCPRGHVLAEPNLVASQVARGGRKCRACSIEAARAHKHGILFDADRADAALAEIMAGRVGVPKQSCPLGHLLAGPNLVPSSLKQGKRQCLACNRARTSSRARSAGFDPAVADEKYRVIMEGVDVRSH